MDSTLRARADDGNLVRRETSPDSEDGDSFCPPRGRRHAVPRCGGGEPHITIKNREHWSFPILAMYTDAQHPIPFHAPKRNGQQETVCWSPSFHTINYSSQASKKGLSLLLLLKPVPRGRLPAGAGGGRLAALDIDGHALVLLERRREVGLLGGGGGLGGREGLDVALGVGGLQGGGLVGLELLEVELLDEVGWGLRMLVSFCVVGWFEGGGGDGTGYAPLRATVGATNMRVCEAVMPLAILDTAEADLTPCKPSAPIHPIRHQHN